MYNYLDFEKPVADLEGKILELKKLAEKRRGGRCRRRDRAAREALARCAARHLQGADALAEGAGGAPSRPAALPRLRRGPVHRFHAARRRPQLRRGRRHRRRLRAFPRRAGRGHRPGKGLRHQEPPQAQFRLGPARGLPQGGAHHGTGRPLRACRWSRWSTPPAPIPASAPRSAARPKPSPARPRPAWRCKVPSISVVIGEGGSGGAIAIATANRVYMLEHAIYSVISPEGAASILWRDTTRSQGRRDQHEDHRAGPAGAEDHRRHHPRAAGRRASRRRDA